MPPQDTAADLDALALAFVVHVQGAWTPQALDTWRTQLARQGFTPTDTVLHDVLERARHQFNTGPTQLFLCNGLPCQKRQKFDAHTDDAFPVTMTACQGPCKQAPVATLRVGQRCEMFARFMRQDEWHAVLDFAARAASARTLLIDPGAAHPFRFDPVHEHESGSGPLHALHFLLGHFQGHATFADGTEAFHKEVVGAWEVGGRFLSLRMSVAYPLADGRNDIHTAMVMLGINPDTGYIDGRVYTDGGAVHDYHLHVDGDTVLFDDRPETHQHVPATRARKVLCPTDSGFEERLELDRGAGAFELHYRAAMCRVT